MPHPWHGWGTPHRRPEAHEGGPAGVARATLTSGGGGRIQQEWWMPPFLVPSGPVAPVFGGTGEEALMQCGVDPASGGPMQHYTNIHRIERLAASHPLVARVERHKARKALDPPQCGTGWLSEAPHSGSVWGTSIGFWARERAERC